MNRAKQTIFGIYAGLITKSIVCLCLLGCPLVGVGQGLQGLRLLGISLDTLLRTTTPQVDRTYITTYDRRLHLFVVSDRQDYTLRVVGAPYSLNYKPNLAWTLGLGIDYKWFGTELTVKLPFLGYNVARKGYSKPFALTINLNNRRLWFSTQYQFYRGFYLNNPDRLQPNWFDQHPAYPYRNDMRSQTITSHLLYQFNTLQVSVPATLLQREEQRRTAGSWVVGASINYQLIRADSSLVFPALQPDFDPTSQLLRLNSLTLAVDAGYMRTVVFSKHYFASFMARPGLALLWRQTKTVSDNSENQIRVGWEGHASVTLGYSTDLYYGGIYGSTAFLNRTFSQGLINTEANYFRLVFGKRIRYQPKGIIKKLPGL